jgi:hypothetical protein
MKKSLLLVAVLCLGIINVSQASIYTFQPMPADMGDLNHAYFYSWAIAFPTLADGEVINGASLTIANLWDSTADANNVLHINLLDSAPVLSRILSPNVTFSQDQGYGFDPANEYANALAGQGDLIAEIHAPLSYYDRSTVTLNFGSMLLADLRNFVSDGTLGFGIDPDCYYANTGITFRVSTSIPEPATLMLLGIALIGGALVAKMRRKSI